MKTWSSLKRGDALYFVRIFDIHRAIIPEPRLLTATVVTAGPKQVHVQWPDFAYQSERLTYSEAARRFSLTAEEAWERAREELLRLRNEAQATLTQTGRALDYIYIGKAKIYVEQTKTAAGRPLVGQGESDGAGSGAT